MSGTRIETKDLGNGWKNHYVQSKVVDGYAIGPSGWTGPVYEGPKTGILNPGFMEHGYGFTGMIMILSLAGLYYIFKR